MKIKYIDDDIQHGIDYDFNLIEREFNKLEIPDNVYNPFKMHKIYSGKWVVDLSERSTGKTTNWLLLGMTMHKLYQTQIIYVREMVDMILPKHAMQLFTTILENGYVEKLTNGLYNTIRYKSRSYFYENTDTGDVAAEPFMCSLSIDENFKNKSSFNAPRGDLIIFDEFISKYNYQNMFIDFCDTVKTVIRERDSAFIVLLANTINQHHVMFKELGVYEDIQHMQIDTQKEIRNAEGTIVDVALIGQSAERMPAHKRKHNNTFFGFSNPLLNSIRGGDWAVRIFPHLPRQESKVETLYNKVYIRYNNYLLHLELKRSDELGLFVNCHIANKTYDDSIIYCMDNTLTNKREYYPWGTRKIDKLLWNLLKLNKWYYATNLEGSLIETYVNDIERM